MDRDSKLLIGIYEERTLLRQLLHHNLEHIQYEILYSCSEVNEFVKNFIIYPVDIILFNAENGIAKLETILNQLNGRKRNLRILFYYSQNDSLLVERFRDSAEVFFCEGTWEDIIISLDKLIFIAPKNEELVPGVSLSPDNPFYQIASNKQFIRILQLLREGKNIKQISAVMQTSESNIAYYIKKMRLQTGCSSIVELVIDAKETGVVN
jgi:DNA-binding NarL/FixJ family response regulator